LKITQFFFIIYECCKTCILPGLTPNTRSEKHKKENEITAMFWEFTVFISSKNFATLC